MIRILLIFVLSIVLCAEDWPCWRGINGDGIAKVAEEINWSMKGPDEVWRVSLGVGYSCLSVADGIVCTLYGDNQYEYCVAFSEHDGKEIWRRRLGYIFVNNHGNGPRSTPAISDGMVYAITSYGELYCLELKNGKKKWSYNILKKFGGQQLVWGTTSSPLIYQGKLFFNTGAQGNKSIVALNKNTGEVEWASSNEQTSYASPVVVPANPPYIVFFTGAACMGVTPDNGKILWRYPWETSSNVNAASPIYYQDNIYFSSDYGMGAIVIKADSQKEYKITEIWKTRKIQNHFSSSILWNEHLFGFDDAILTCINFTTGETTWKQRGFKKGTITGLTNGSALVLGEDGSLALIELNTSEYIEKGMFRPFPNTVCRTIPTVANNRIFMRNQEEAVCFNLGDHRSE